MLSCLARNKSESSIDSSDNDSSKKTKHPIQEKINKVKKANRKEEAKQQKKAEKEKKKIENSEEMKLKRKQYYQDIIDFLRQNYFTTPVSTFSNLSKKNLVTVQILWDEKAILITHYQCTIQLKQYRWEFHQFYCYRVDGFNNLYYFSITCSRRGNERGCFPTTYVLELSINVLDSTIKDIKGNKQIELGGNHFYLEYFRKKYYYSQDNEKQPVIKSLDGIVVVNNEKNNEKNNENQPTENKKTKLVRSAKVKDELVKRKKRLQSQKQTVDLDDYAFIPTRITTELKMNMPIVESDDPDNGEIDLDTDVNASRIPKGIQHFTAL